MPLGELLVAGAVKTEGSKKAFDARIADHSHLWYQDTAELAAS